MQRSTLVLGRFTGEGDRKPSSDDKLRIEFRCPTAQEIQRNMDSGRRLPAEAVAAAIAGLRRAVRDLARKSGARLTGRHDHAASAASAISTTVAATRNSASSLRDDPEMTPVQRVRVIGNLLAEERRLDRLTACASRSVESR